MLAGGGYVASSWELGLLTGMIDSGLDVRNADLFVGTSAGARVALDLTSGRDLEETYQQRAESAGPPVRPPDGPSPAPDWVRIKAGVDHAKQLGGSSSDVLRRYGELALSVAVAGTARRETVAAQLPLLAWPEQRVLITAVNADTGERRAFDRESGIPLVDAVIATTASFGATPIVFGGHPYIDGGYYSGDNSDLAIGHERVLILSLRAPPQAMRLVSLESAIEALRASGSQVEVIHPDEETMAALMPTGGQMNPASGGPSAIAGRLQGRRAARGGLASFWR
ncbi:MULTISPECIES: patatin-like phospholipase family protein [unclassified Mesorhizobium]|uniref:patatin-like phospholipase family protein n=1 Tax=unclassified Mesorhizobium TaxID=325217 RepID=UPI001FEF8E9E|nr:MULTISPECIES: patatin-like phospholipase family protein [unclassified Mesorhizobium]